MTQNMERLQALKSDKKFVNKAFWAYNWSIPMNFTRERMLGCSMVSMLARVADEIYPEDTAKQQELCRNHEVFFNTQQGLGAVIYGIVLGMEVERAHDDSITNELIQSIKQALAGYGRAEKKQVQQMVKTILHLEKVPKPDDTADALAVAVCHGNSCGAAARMSQAIEKALAAEKRGKTGEECREKKKTDGFRIIRG